MYLNILHNFRTGTKFIKIGRLRHIILFNISHPQKYTKTTCEFFTMYVICAICRPLNPAEIAKKSHNRGINSFKKLVLRRKYIWQKSAILRSHSILLGLQYNFADHQFPFTVPIYHWPPRRFEKENKRASLIFRISQLISEISRLRAIATLSNPYSQCAQVLIGNAFR